MRHPAAIRTSLAALAGFSLLLTACSPAAGPVLRARRLRRVPSTLWPPPTSTATSPRLIGGDKVNVTSIITKTSQDPHSYEATAQDRLAVSKAELVIENGGGYDEFLHKMADDSNIAAQQHPDCRGGGRPGARRKSHTESAAAHDEAGHDHQHGEFNEHAWYSLDAMGKLADSVAAKLGELEPGSAARFTANAATFKTGVDGLNAKLAALKAKAAGSPVAVTEPVPLYLLEAAGLENRTPEDYTAAIEEGSDVPPAVLKAATDLAGSTDIRFLAYNEQTEGPQTRGAEEGGRSGRRPVIDFSETLPEGKTYLQWMTDNVDNVSKVLEKNS